MAKQRIRNMNVKERVVVNVYPDTFHKLKSIGEYGDTMDSIINKCIDAYEELKKQEKEKERKEVRKS